jgi:quinol-cytochrome oxidoreductase complex cytochrome b subunit
MWSPPKSYKDAVTISRRYFSPLKEMKWGAWALIALYISLLSGVIVGLQYDYSTPSYSTASIDLLAPYGSFFRSLHFYSSQVFFFFCCVHLLAIYNKTENQGYAEWMRLIVTLPVILLLLFTGYILRGDNTGTSAGMIAESIVQAIPAAGSSLNDLLFSLTDSGLRKVYIHHVIALDIVLLILGWNHLRIYRVKVRDHRALIAAMLLFSILISAPFDPDHPGTSYISGPWFFLGLQELLRYLPSLIAGVVVPVMFLWALFSIHPANKRKCFYINCLGFWLGGYAILSAVAWFR